MNDVDVESLSSLKSALAVYQDGEEVKVDVLRNENTQELTVTLGSDPFEDEFLEAYSYQLLRLE